MTLIFCKKSPSLNTTYLTRAPWWPWSFSHFCKAQIWLLLQRFSVPNLHSEERSYGNIYPLLSFEHISMFGNTVLVDKYMYRSYTWTDLEITVNQMSNGVLFHLQTPLCILFPKAILKVRRIQRGTPPGHATRRVVQQ